MKVKLEHYKSGYNRLYSFLRTKHPDVLDEYKALMKKARDLAAENYELVSSGDNDK